MDDEHLVVEQGADRLDVWLDRPEKLNALPASSVESLADTFAAVTTDTTPVVVVRGRGDHFSVGADLAELEPETASERRATATRYMDLVASVRECPAPVVAGVQGRAIGAGFLLALAADFVVARPEATFSIPEVGLGMPVSGFATSLLPTLVGEHVARDWLFTGRDVDAAEAADVGFVSRLTATLDDELDDLVATLAANSSSAIAMLKSRMAPPAADVDDVREAEAEAMERAFTDGDAHERIEAYLE